MKWYEAKTGNHQGLIVEEETGRNVAVTYEKKDAALIIALVNAARCALADLEGIMPEFEPSGDRTHPGWTTISELRQALGEIECGHCGEPIEGEAAVSSCSGYSHEQCRLDCEFC